MACMDLSNLAHTGCMGEEFGPGYTDPLLKVNLCLGVKETQKRLQTESQLQTALKRVEANLK